MADACIFRAGCCARSRIAGICRHRREPGPDRALNVATVIRSDGGGFWTCAMTDVSLGARAIGTNRTRQRNATLLWRAVRQLANGGASLLVVPRNDALFRPWPAGVALAEVETPHSDG
jgi:hypothetical protein